MSDVRAFRVIVPVKRFAEAKSRMDIRAPALTVGHCGPLGAPTTLAPGAAEGRTLPRGRVGPRLAEAMLADTLAVLAGARSAERIVLVSREPVAASMARERGLACVRDPGLGLNEALRVAIELDRGSNPSRRTAVIPTDLVALTPDSLDALLGAVDHPRWFVPDASTTGTALLGLPGGSAAGAILSHFGEGSASRHRAAGFVPVAWPPGADLTDADTPEDLRGRRLGPAVTRLVSEIMAPQAWVGPSPMPC